MVARSPSATGLGARMTGRRAAGGKGPERAPLLMIFAAAR